MKKLLVLSLLLVGCTEVEYKVHFDDRVRITKGFYKGLTGRVTSTCVGAGNVKVDADPSDTTWAGSMCEHQDNLEVIKL